MLVLSWAFSALSAPLSPRNISCAWKGSLMFCFIFVSVFVFFSFCFWDCEWCSWDGGDKSHFIRLQHPSACKTWLVFLLLCLSWAFSGHWWTWPHSSWGIFNLLESTEKSHCRFPVAHQSNQYPSTAFLLLCLLLPGGKIITAHSRLHLGGVQLREARTSSKGTPRRLDLTPLSGKQTTSFCHPFCCFPLKWVICTHTKYFGGMRMFLLLCPLCRMHYPLIIISILPLLRKCWSLLLYVLWLQFSSSGNSWLTWLRFTSLSDLKRPL